MKHFLLTTLLCVGMSAQAQTDVTKKYIDNPDFAARFAGWTNTDMTFNTATNSFTGRSGEVWMEKWVTKGTKVGSNHGMSQPLKDLAPGTYTLTVSAQNVQQGKDEVQTGAYVFAGEEQTEVNVCADYKVRFTILTGNTTIGIKTKDCTGNWVCVDNFRLQFEGYVVEEADKELQRLIDAAEGVLAEGGQTADELRKAIDAAKAAKGTAEASLAAEKAVALQRATLNYRVHNGTGSKPSVTTHPYVAIGTTIALGRLNVTGNGILESGFCWSTEPEPTILDNRSTRVLENKGSVYVMEKLAPATIYYVRAYALTKTDQVAYGDVVKIATLPFGKVTCDYDYAGDEQTNYRINSAIQECIWLWNNLCHIEGKNISVHYVPGSGAGGGTADCNINGWMRVSQNIPYQQTGTMFHETNHGMGVGTTDSWYNNANLRANVSRGDWLGPRATQLVRFFENNNTAMLTGDGTHMWPYGINGAHEDSYNPENTCLYFANALITHALHQDGLCYQWWGTPPVAAYVFEQDDAKKYYFMNEGDQYGLGKAYLVSSSVGKLTWAEMTSEEARANDYCAWYITFDPKTQMYQFKNAATGKYITTTMNANGRTPNDLQLLPGRTDVTVGGMTKSGFWVLSNSDNGQAALVAKANGATGPISFNHANTAVQQRWIIFSEDELGVYADPEPTDAPTVAANLLANLRALVATPHTDAVEGTTAAFESQLAAWEGQLEGINDDKLKTLKAEVIAAVPTFLHDVVASDFAQPFDVSFMIANPRFANGKEGWTETTGSGTLNYGCIEYNNEAFDINQTINNMPVGTYKCTFNAFQCPSASAADAIDAVTTTVLYINAATGSAKVPNICSDAQQEKLGGNETDLGGLYVPANIMAASRYFAAGLYQCELLRSVTSAKGYASVKIGVKNAKAATSHWNVFTGFKLYYYGNVSKEDVTPVATPEATVKPVVIYDLAGRRVNKPTHGIYIVNGKKVKL